MSDLSTVTITKEECEVWEAEAKEALSGLNDALSKYESYDTQLREACFKIRDSKGYEQLGYSSFVEWGLKSLGLNRSYVQQLALNGATQAKLIEEINERPQAADNTKKDNPPGADSSKSDENNITKGSIEALSDKQLRALNAVPEGNRLDTLEKLADEAIAKGENNISTKAITKEAKAIVRANNPDQAKIDQQADANKIAGKAKKLFNSFEEEFKKLNVDSDKRACGVLVSYAEISIATLKRDYGLATAKELQE